jgi:hypothetical protein
MLSLTPSTDSRGKASEGGRDRKKNGMKKSFGAFILRSDLKESASSNMTRHQNSTPHRLVLEKSGVLRSNCLMKSYEFAGVLGLIAYLPLTLYTLYQILVVSLLHRRHFSIIKFLNYKLSFHLIFFLTSLLEIIYCSSMILTNRSTDLYFLQFL